VNAWLLDAMVGIETLRLADAPDPVPGAGEALLAISLAGLNPADRYLAKDEYPGKPAMPHILGRDGLGVIQSVGNDVTVFKPGDRVIVLRSEIGVTRPGTFAQKVAVPVESLAPIPPGWTDEQSAGAALVYLTAYQALTQWGELKPSVVLITGASGGVGVAATQLATAMGHDVVALSRSSTKGEQLKNIGAKFVADPTNADWPKVVRSFLGTRKVDLAIDNIGGPDFSKVISLLGYNGKLSAIGRLAGPVPEFNTSTLFFRRIKIGGVAVGDYKPAEAQTAWNKIVEIMNAAGSRPLVDSVFAFEKLLDGFSRLHDGPMGKVLVQIGGA
jgi:NADPH2:quinone reductase